MICKQRPQVICVDDTNPYLEKLKETKEARILCQTLYANLPKKYWRKLTSVIGLCLTVGGIIYKKEKESGFKPTKSWNINDEIQYHEEMLKVLRWERENS